MIGLMRRWRYWVLAGIAVICTIALVACNPHQFKTAAAAKVTQIVASTPGDPKTFNYAFLSSYPNIFTFTYEGLIGESGKGEVEPALAESWKWSSDKLNLTFKLRDGLKWSDGQPLTVDDVLFTFNEIYLNEKIPTETRDSLKIGKSEALPKVRKVNDREIEFSTPEPFAPLLRSVGVPILPAHVLRSTILETDKEGKLKFLSTWGTDTNPKDVIVNGPYRMVEYVSSQRLVYERNPYYWRKDKNGRSLPYIDRLVWQIVENRDTSLLQFRSGGLDVLAIGPATFSLLKREEQRGNFTIVQGGPDSGTSFIAFNLNKGRRNGQSLVDPVKSKWFNTKEFRQAVAYGIDRQTMINNAFRGLGDPINSPISVYSPYYLSPKDGLKTYDYNPEKSKQLLQSVGFKYTPDGKLQDANNQPVRFTLSVPVGSRLTEAIVAQIKNDLAKIGMQVDLQSIDFGTLVDRMDNQMNLEAYYIGFTAGVEPNGAANLWNPDGGSHSFNLKPREGQAPIEGREVADWEKRIGDLYIQAAKELDETKRKALYDETQRITQENVPLIYLVNPKDMAAIRNTIKGVDLSPLYYESILWNIYNLQVTK